MRGKQLALERLLLPPRVNARDAAACQVRGEPFKVVHGEVERGWPEESGESDRLAKVHPDAAVRAGAEGHVAAADAPPHAQRHEPTIWAADLPTDDVVQPGPKAEEAEAGVQMLMIQSGPRVPRANAEGQKQPALPRTET